jgi:hypothetical protein
MFVSELETQVPTYGAGGPVVMELMLQTCTIGEPELILSLKNAINMNHFVNVSLVYLWSRVLCLPLKIIFLYVC